MNGGINIGIGQGFAQVIDTFRYTQAIQRQLEINEAKERQEQQEIAQILAQYNPEGMRQQDIAGFYKDYNELKSLYLNNKGLYSHPADHPEDFARAQHLQQSMKVRSTMSREMNQFYGKVGEKLMENPYKYAKGTVQRYKDWGNKTIEEIADEFGGRLPSIQDIELKPVAPDYERAQKEMLRLGMYQDKLVPVTKDQNPDIPEGKMMLQVNKVINPEAASIVANRMWADDDHEKYYFINAFDEIKNDPAHIQEIEDNVNKKMNTTDFRIKDAKSLAFAELMVNNSVIPGESKVVDDPQYKRTEEERKHKRDRIEKRSDMALRHAWDLDRNKEEDALRRELRGKTSQDVDNEFSKSVESFRQAFRQGKDSNGKSREYYLHSLIGHPDNTRDPEYLDPNKMSESAFVSKIKMLSATNKNQKQYQISDAEAREMWKKKASAVALYQWDERATGVDEDGYAIKGGEKVMLFNPLNSNFAELLKPIIKKAKVSLSKNDREEGIFE